MRLVIIEDKNTGHNRPLNALVDELSKLQESEIIQFGLNDDASQFTNNLQKSVFSETLILGAGHRSHKKIIALQKCIAKKESAIGVALMKPTFCINQYDLVIAPNHDFLNRKIPNKVITHDGSLSQVSHAHVIENTILILPIHKSIEKSINILLAVILVVKIVRVFPHVNHKYRNDTFY